MAAFFALSGALLWGVGDFIGGFVSRRVAVLAVVAISQTVGLAGVLLWVLLSGDRFPGVVELAPAAAGGVAGLVGLAALYRGMAVGAMGIVAPISAVAPVVPLAADVARGIVPSGVQWIGVALALVGIVMLSREPPGGEGPRVAAGVGLAVVAALGFGTFFVGLDASADESVPWAVAAVRATAVTCALTAIAATSTPVRIRRGLLLTVAVGGIFDTTANVAFAAASAEGDVGIVAVLSSLYPLVTVAIARIVLRERLTVARRAGGLLALAGAALVAAGS